MRRYKFFYGPKQTAGNNKFLAGVKRMMNKPIFLKTSEVLNLSGEVPALAYLQQHFNTPVTVEFFKDFKGFGK